MQIALPTDTFPQHLRAPGNRLFGQDALAKLRVHLTYMWRHHRTLDLVQAARFTEMVQRRKLEPVPAWQASLMDKLAAKDMAKRALGAEWIVPTIWSGTQLPLQRPFPCPAIIKARHGCNQFRPLPQVPSQIEWETLQSLTKVWTAKPYGLWLDEAAYRDVPRGLVAETLLGDGVTLPLDYKIYVFGGQATHVQVHIGRSHKHRWVLHDRAWNQLVKADDAPPPPRSLNAMLAAAEALARGTDFMRVDFYEIEGKPLFGEFCLYPGSGLDPFAADWIDFELGDLWHQAQSHQYQSAAASLVSDTNTSSRSGSRVVTSSMP